MITIEYKPVGSLKSHDRNPRKILDDDFEVLKASIKANPDYFEVRPILCTPDGTVFAGNMRLKAANALGMKEVPVAVMDISEERQRELMIRDNVSNGLWDHEILGADFEIAELKDWGYDVDAMGAKDATPGKYSDSVAGSIADKYIIPPFSILDTRQGKWQDRRHMWLDLGISSEEGRGDDLLGLQGLSDQQGGTSIFDPVLAELSYKWFSPRGGKIIDPFCGGSVRGIVAAKLGFEYAGTELSQKQVDENKKQGADIIKEGEPMPNWICDDAKNIAAHIQADNDLLFTCPPYADLEVYSKDPRDISNMKYADFLKAYRDIIKTATGLLKENRFAVIVIGEVRGKAGDFINFVPDTIHAFEDAGLHYYNEMILVNMLGTLPLRVNKQFISGRKIGKTHQNVLVFWKGDMKAISPTVKDWQIDVWDPETDPESSPQLEK